MSIRFEALCTIMTARKARLSVYVVGEVALGVDVLEGGVVGLAAGLRPEIW